MTSFGTARLAEMDRSIEIVMLKLVYIENLMMFGHSERKLRRSETFIIYSFIWVEFPLYIQLQMTSKKRNFQNAVARALNVQTS